MIIKENKALKIGLTGGIGSGKSTVANVFSVLGIPIFQSDIRAKQIIHENEQVRQAITKQFGKKSYLEDGSYNNKYIAGIVFSDAKQLKALNKIVHPAVFQEQADWFEEQTTAYAIVENAILYEANTAHRFDKVIVVQAKDELRIKRIMERDGINRAEVLQRFESQLPQAKKVKLADFVIYNNEEQSLIEQVQTIHNSLSEE